MKPLSEDPKAADLEPMTDAETAWARLARCPADAPDRAALAVEIGQMFRHLREAAGLSQIDLATYSEGLHNSLVSAWERAERLSLLPRHAAYLIDAVGLEVLNLVGPSMAARGFGADLNERVAAGIEAHLREPIEARAAARAAGDHETVERLEGHLGRLPTLEELAERLGIERPVSVGDQVALIHSVIETGRQGGWTIGRSDDQKS